MFYKPKFCCNCGVEIERVEWKLWSSRRFCEVCETDFKPQEWLPRAVAAAGVLLGLLGLGTYLQPAEKPLQIASRQSAENFSDERRQASDAKGQIAANSNLQMTSSAAGSAPAAEKTSSTTDVLTQKSPAIKAETKSADPAPTFFCGAATKKGTPCSRRVKGGGRCWQHTGQPAILPPEKLSASR